MLTFSVLWLHYFFACEQLYEEEKEENGRLKKELEQCKKELLEAKSELDKVLKRTIDTNDKRVSFLLSYLALFMEYVGKDFFFFWLFFVILCLFK